MPIKRATINATVACNLKIYPPGFYRCGYRTLATYIIAAGNPQGTAIFDTRWERLTTTPLTKITVIDVVPYDDDHVQLSCQCEDDSIEEIAPIRIISLYNA
jgi:hypothetical protein